jgi:mannitol/fructose-specific phosphotransferase system IIA component (Ntr-type)
MGILKYFKKNKPIIKEDKRHDFGLTDLLPLENIEIVEKAENWEDAVKLSGRILLKNGYIKDSYIEDMIGIIKKSGLYMVIGKDIILPHAENRGNVNQAGLSFLLLKKAVEFPEEYKIKNVVTLASNSKEETVGALMQLKKIIDATSFLEKLEDVKTEEEILDLITYYKKLLY